MGIAFTISGQIVDVVAGRIFPGHVNVESGRIKSIVAEEGVSGPFILPGLIDAHIHIESSMLVPAEFARIAVKHGTVATVSDPHEIANVLGMDGIRFMVENGKHSPFYFYFGAPSCVPATAFETAGNSVGPDEIEELLSSDDIKYLSEMMNFPGVIYDDPGVHEKLALAKKFGKPVDGHAPGLTGEQLVKYAGAGISTDHECSTLDEALEKIGLGMHILIREGSAARNFDNLLPLLKLNPEMVMFCSDDKHPDELLKGHMNQLISRAVKAGYDVIDAIRACTLNPVKHYRLGCGLLQPGDPADFILTGSLSEFNILETYIQGILCAKDGNSLLEPVISSRPNHFKALPVDAGMLAVPVSEGFLKVIKAYEGELLTGVELVKPFIREGQVISQAEEDLLKICVINRYQPSKPAMGFIRGFGLNTGALASTVAHDSHNLICIGTNDADMATAINLLVESKGGIAISADGISELLPLPIAGIMTDADGETVGESYEHLNRFAGSLGCKLKAPFMTLSFMALLVIPELKLSDRGLFDGKRFSFTDLFVKDIPD